MKITKLIASYKGSMDFLVGAEGWFGGLNGSY